MTGMFMMITLSVVILLLMVVAGVYVYRDAKQRGMNAVLWTLVAVLTPSLIGFIIYLLERTNHSNMKCPKCGMVIKEDYVVCPRCSAKLRASCPNCFAPIHKDWTVCARCACPLPELQDDIDTPIRTKDKTLGKVLFLIFLIPALLLVILVINFMAFSSISGATSTQMIEIDEYLQKNNNPDVREWIDESGKEYNKAYVLQYEYEEETEETDKQVKTGYLIYTPWLTENGSVSVKLTSGLFGPVLQVKTNDIGGNSGNEILLVHYRGNKEPKLEVYYNDKRVECDITKTGHSFFR